MPSFINRSVRSQWKNPSFFNLAVLSLYLIFFALAGRAYSANQVTVGWNASNDQAVVGYKIHYGNQSGNYQHTVDVGNKTTFTLTGVSADQTYYFAATAYDANGHESDYSQELVCHTISATAGQNGSIIPGGIIVTSDGLSQTFTIKPNSNYYISDVQVDGASVGPVSAYKFSYITRNHDIYAKFAANNYTITTAINGQGAITPSGQVAVNTGEAKTFYIEPAGNYHTSDVQVDGISIGPVSSYTFNHVDSNHTISAFFSTNGSPDTYANTTVYEDAEDGFTKGWIIYGQSAGAEISNVSDADRQNRVIELTGSGTQTGYRLGDEALSSWDSKWQNSSQFFLQWSMKYSEPFIVYVDVETTAGHRYLWYTPDENNQLGNSGYVHHGLGNGAADGKWHSYARDLQADLQDAQPDSAILEVNAFLIRGSGRIDDIRLLGNSTTYEDAEDGFTKGWIIYGQSAGAEISNVSDADRQNRVIELTGSGTQTGYRLGDEALSSWDSKWQNSSQFILQWSMKYSEPFIVYVDVETTAGHRYLWYTPDENNQLGSGEYVHHGIGSNAKDGKWHTFERDLQADLEDAQPGNKILEVNAFLIRGSGRVDEICLT